MPTRHQKVEGEGAALIRANQNGLEVQPGSALNTQQATVSISWFWLRDHAEDEAGRDPVTMQRRVDTFSIEPNCRGTVVGLDNKDNPTLDIQWEDGVCTTHSRAGLYQVAEHFLATEWSRLAWSEPALPSGITMWADAPPEPAKLAVEDLLNDDDALAAGLATLNGYGYLVLDGDKGSKDTAIRFAQRMGYVRHTIFGGIWDLAADLTEHSDTAYTDIFLGCHTDATYSNDAPGYQYFVCVQPATQGGESLLLDGFAIAAELAESEPHFYRDLASIPVIGRYIEPGVHLEAERPVFRSGPRGVLSQVSFNNYDRAPFLLPSELEPRFYAAYTRFAELANDPKRRIEVSLSEGDILVFNNWRVLHGRNSFVGPRHYVGAYLNHEDIESKKRILA